MLNQRKSDKVLVASTKELDAWRMEFDERQRLKDFEDQLVDILLVLDTTHDTILSLLDKYKQYCSDCRRHLECIDDQNFDSIESALGEKQRDVKSTRRKIETLLAKIRGTTKLVSDR